MVARQGHPSIILCLFASGLLTKRRRIHLSSGCHSLPGRVHLSYSTARGDGEGLGASGLRVTLLEQLGCPLCPLHVRAECLSGQCSFSGFSHADEFLMVLCRDAA